MKSDVLDSSSLGKHCFGISEGRRTNGTGSARCCRRLRMPRSFGEKYHGAA